MDAHGRTSLADALRAGPLGARRIVGSSLGPYEVVSELGRGGFGVVLRARRRDEPGPDVALKVLLEGAQAAATRQRRFAREATVSEALSHPGIVTVRDSGELEGLAYIAFEFVEGTTLDRALEGASVDRALDLLTEVARAVAFAHEHGVVHRDLKPANVLVRASDGRALVTDFGLARDTNLASSLTKTGAALGTPSYMAPEQVMGKPPSPATDVFALGVMLHEALTGALPFRAENLAMRYAAILAGRVEAPSALREGVPRGVDDVVRQALAAKPEQRQADAGAFADALEATRAPGGRSSAKATGKTSTKRFAGAPRVARALLAVGVLVAVGVVAAVPLARRRREAAARDEAVATVDSCARDLSTLLAGSDRSRASASAAAVESAVRAFDVLGAAGDADAAANAASSMARARVALAAWHLREGRLDDAQRALDAIDATATGREVEVGRALLLVARSEDGAALDALRGDDAVPPWAPDQVDDARARVLAARGAAADALRALDRALAHERTAGRHLLRARLLFGARNDTGALEAYEAALALDARTGDVLRLDPDFAAGVARACLDRATGRLARPDTIEPAIAAGALADLRAASAIDPAAAKALAGRAHDAALSLLARMAGERGPPPTADTTRVAHGLLDVATALDATLSPLPPGYFQTALPLCQRKVCPPSVRFQIGSRLDRLKDDAFQLDLNLNDPAADFSAPWRLLRKQLREARAPGKTTEALNAYRTFSHATRGVPSLVAVGWEAEEEGLTLYPPGTPGRYHVLLARALTLQVMKRSDEARPIMDEAVRLCADLGPDALSDTIFWRATFMFGEGRFAESLADLEGGIAVLARAGQQPPNGYWHIHLAACLHELGRDEEALEAVRAARRLEYPTKEASDELQKKIKAALKARR